MHYIKLRYRLFLFILLFWFLLNFSFEIETIVMGILLSVMVTIASFRILHDENGFLYHSIRIEKLFVYVAVLFYEIFRSSFTYVWNLVGRKYVPVVFEMKLEVEDPIQVGIIANSITLTPGTITIDISQNVITVMTLAKPDVSIEEIERPIRERFEKLLKEKKKEKEQ